MNHTHRTPLTTPPPTTAGAPPPILHAISVLDARCMQYGGHAVREGGARVHPHRDSSTKMVRMQARVGTPRPPPPTLTRALTCHQNTTRDQIGAKLCTWGVKGGASGAPTLACRCTVRRTATTAQTRGNCSVQPTLPFTPMTCFHTDLAGSETAQLSALIGSDKSTRLSDGDVGQVRAHMLWHSPCGTQCSSCRLAARQCVRALP